METMRKFLRDRYEWMIPVVHFLLTFLWQGNIFVGHGSWEFYPSLVRNGDLMPGDAELWMVYALSRVFCFFIIWGFWKLVFFVLRNDVSKDNKIILGGILVTGLILGIFFFPTLFGIEVDNYTNYLMVRRFQPTYWQGVYTGALYGGCLMVLPHPIGIFVFQWVFFWAVTSYAYLGIERVRGTRKNMILWLLLLPESYLLAFNAYRNNFYTILVFWFLAYLYFHVKDPTKEIRIKDTLLFSLMTAFIMVWRSEGLFWGLGGLAVWLLFVLKGRSDRKKQILVSLVSLCLLFLIIRQMQELGNKKYYGQDYMIINTTDVLQAIFINPDAHLTYQGAESDVNAIEAIVPVEILKEYGMDGYRDYNWTMGRRDFNQSLATDQQADAYVSAYFRIVMNNLGTYLRVQLSNFLSAMQIPVRQPAYAFQGEHFQGLEHFVYGLWRSGQEEVLDSWQTRSWKDNAVRSLIATKCDQTIGMWREIFFNFVFNAILHVFALVAVIVMFFKEFLCLVGKKKEMKYQYSLAFVIASLTILGEFAACILFMPAGREAYLYPVLYASYFILYVYGIERGKAKNRKEKKKA